MKIRASIVHTGVAFALAALLASHALAAGGITGVVNVNSATADELALLPGVGPARAQAILEHRKAHGAFKRVEELGEVKGIGDKALERLRPHVTLDGKTTAQPAD
jgi:competence protein ComEA